MRNTNTRPFCYIRDENIYFGQHQNSIKLSEIVMLKAMVNYTNIYLSNGKKVLFSKTIKRFEEILPTLSFIRTHKAFLINKDHIKNINYEGDLLTLTNDLCIPISSRNRKHVMASIANDRVNDN